MRIKTGTEWACMDIGLFDVKGLCRVTKELGVNSCVVYGLYAEGEDVIRYVGSTEHVSNRMGGHRAAGKVGARNKWFPTCYQGWIAHNGDRVRVRILDEFAYNKHDESSVEMRVGREQTAIDLIEPGLNTKRVVHRPPRRVCVDSA